MDPVILSIYCWILVAYKWTFAVQTYCSSVDCVFFFILNHIGDSTHNIFRSDQNEGNSYCWWGRGFSNQDLEMLLPSGLSLINFYFLLLLQRTTFSYSFHSAKWSLFFSGSWYWKLLWIQKVTHVLGRVPLSRMSLAVSGVTKEMTKNFSS